MVVRFNFERGKSCRYSTYTYSKQLGEFLRVGEGGMAPPPPPKSATVLVPYVRLINGDQSRHVKMGIEGRVVSATPSPTASALRHAAIRVSHRILHNLLCLMTYHADDDLDVPTTRRFSLSSADF